MSEEGQKYMCRILQSVADKEIETGKERLMLSAVWSLHYEEYCVLGCAAL
jgi:hypothetical protein